MWNLSTKERGDGPLPDHLSALLDAIEPKREVLDELAAEGFVMDWFCHVVVPGNGGLTLEPDLLRRLAALPVKLDLDIYG